MLKTIKPLKCANKGAKRRALIKIHYIKIRNKQQVKTINSDEKRRTN